MNSPMMIMSTLSLRICMHLIIIIIIIILLVHPSFASTHNSDTCLAYSPSPSPSFHQCEANSENYDGESPSVVWNNFADEYQDLPRNAGTFSIKKSNFPPNFMFGTASSSYQYEGAVNEGGRSPSIWDTYTHKYPEKIKDHSNGAISVDSYHRFKEDVDIMKDIGLNAYRFSISWTRILPGGNLSGGVNKEGIQYYNNLINYLLSNGIEPFVTIFHWDSPEILEDAYGGFLSPRIVDDYKEYAEVCFKEFGDRVKHWITLNGPSILCQLGYANVFKAPGRCSSWLPYNCTGPGDSATEPYIVGHHQLLAHAAAVQLYRQNYQKFQMGQIGIAHSIDWVIPLSNSAADLDATSRALAFKIGWFMQPLISGSYPAEMIQHVGDRLPRFSQHQSKMLQASFDFVGINYYTTNYVTHAQCPLQNQTCFTDSCTDLRSERNGIPIGRKGASDWIYLYPQGIEELLIYMKDKYNNPAIYITENGYPEPNVGKISLQDKIRIDCHIQHLHYIHSAMRNGVDVKGYFAWSLLDNFEWADGYTIRFGIVFVDYKDGLKRYLKDSAKWFKNFLHQ